MGEIMYVRIMLKNLDSNIKVATYLKSLFLRLNYLIIRIIYFLEFNFEN